ncbi:MAG: major outer membrane protein [Helicobacter sp.]|uniref:major outer membrane protein n=1 Tax=Helicobacter sp. TaxID=218 RepID=UPI0023D3B463|nr:major outer membrane protein [Helicobacter sp.]MDE7176145.1 major outer membrane protein [Helicobacter sp.]
MKFLKLSLAASVALGAFSTASFAQPLEDAIKGIDVSGYLRYRYNSDYYENKGFAKKDGGDDTNTHRWKAVADFKAPVADNVAFNFGILYNNEQNNVQGTGGLGTGFGSGKDGSFGVSTFNAVITPDSTATTVIIGKQRLATPVTNAGDDDRGTGILVLNSDLEGFTFAAGAFDSWSIDDVQKGYLTGDNTGGSVTKPLYALAGIYGVDTDYGHFGAQLWGFYIQDAVDALGFGELSWNNATFDVALQYAIASLNNDSDSVLGVLHGPAATSQIKSNIAEANDLFVLNLGANFAQEYDVPLDVKLGWVTNFQDGTAVTLNDDGTAFKYAGAIWWQNAATGISTSALLPTGVHGFGTEQEISVFYGAIGYSMIDNRLRIGLDYVWGNNEVTSGNATIKDTDFQEITPRISWKHNKNLTISGYYAYLMTDAPSGAQYDDETRARARVEVKYSF